MNTPDRNRINPPLSAPFEDSPVFSFINSLSPIKPVKSAFNSLGFSSPPSVFTSPHVNALRESRFHRSHNPAGTSNPKVSSEDAINSTQGISLGDAFIEVSVEQAKFSVELPQALKYNSGSPCYDPPICGDDPNTVFELPGEAALDLAPLHEGCKVYSVKREVHLQGICQIEPKSEGPECDWDSSIPNANDLMIFNSPNEAQVFKGLMQKQSDYYVQLRDYMSLLPQSMINNGLRVDSVSSGYGQEIQDHPPEPIAAGDTDNSQDNTNDAKVDDELASVMHRGTRRRCLDFEMASVRRKKTDNNSRTDSDTSHSDEKSAANESQLLPAKRNANSQRRMLRGIGLHLNTVASIKDNESIHDSTSSLQTLSASQEHHHLALLSVSSERELDPSDNGVQPSEDCSQASGYMAGEDDNQNSPKKKRHRLEPAGETEGCKRCNCKKSKCLKLYCECFAAGVYCVEPCSCQDCFNKPVHEDTVLQTRKQIESRNPLAFAPKVIRSSDSAPEMGDDPNKTPASARHKRGCNCKKSSCLKKYCECYQGGVGCSVGCRCEGCKNTYGIKDGSTPIGLEAEPEEETEACEKSVVEKALQKTDTQNIEDHPDYVPITTPLRLSRPLLPLPFSSKGKPPRTFVTTISNSGLFASQKLGIANSLWTQPKHLQTVADDDVLDVLQGHSSPVACIKTSSPNGKRISSPNCELRSSPSRRGGRKLILQAIPSFPSLNPHH